MKMVIIMIVLVAAAILAIFVVALIGVAASQSAWEQMLEDEEQGQYIMEWMRKKDNAGKQHNISGPGSVHNAEPENNHGKMADGRGLSGQKE